MRAALVARTRAAQGLPDPGVLARAAAIIAKREPTPGSTPGAGRSWSRPVPDERCVEC